jgi:Protein of unknown function (DUF1573)
VTWNSVLKMLAVSALAVATASCSRCGGFKSAGGSRPPELPLAARPESADLGTLTAGQSGRSELFLFNESGGKVELERVTTSCPCVRVVGTPLSIGPGLTAKLSVAFDPSEDPDFRGSLRVEVKGLNPDGDQVLYAHVTVEVKSLSR